MSVVTLLSAVSGTVALVHHHNHGADSAAGNPAAAAGPFRTTGSAEVIKAGGSGSFASAALALNLRAVPLVPTAADQRQLRIEAQARQKAAADAAAAEAAEAEKRAKVRAAQRAEAAADRRREEIRQRASRSAHRDPQALARVMVAERGWSSGQFGCLQSLWDRESGWNYRATNPSSGAYGIPQALPGAKMAAAGSDWRTSPATQMRWGLGYIAERYGTPCGAWGHSESHGWY